MIHCPVATTQVNLNLQGVFKKMHEYEFEFQILISHNDFGPSEVDALTLGIAGTAEWQL